MTSLKTNIVVVDDEPDTTDMFAEMIQLQGYKAIKSYGGASAIDIISKVIPDTVILDIMMPDISGIEVLRYMRKDPKLENIPVIVASVKSLPSDINDGLEAGASIYLTKPVSYDDLIQAIEKTLSSSGMVM